MIYFTSDLHAFHKNILDYDNLPFCSVEVYREFIVKTWNDLITDEDEVYLLGDTCVGGRGSEIDYFLQSLKGKKYLVKGNHEKEIMKNKSLHRHFVWIKDYFVFDYQNQRFVLMHFPIEEWLNKSHGSIHLHGHSHGSSRPQKNRLDVGFSASGLNIWSIDDVVEYIKKVNAPVL